MMKSFSSEFRILKGCLVALVVAVLGGLTNAQASLPISDVPLFVVTGANPNVLINLSVETPVGGPAYNDMNDAGCLQDVLSRSSMVCYTASKNHLGYFDPNKCYLYDNTNEYFYPTGPAGADHTCSGSFSGNMLNWSTMNAIDTFVWTMTGGDRVVDTQAETVVEVFGASNFWKGKSKAITATHNVAPGTVSPFAATDLVLTVDQQGTGGNSTVSMITQGGGWTVTTDSAESTGEDGAADNAIDGNSGTIWHTEWYNSDPPHPHWIQIDLGAEEDLGGLAYLPRQGSYNGTIADYRILLSSDGVSFSQVASGTWATTQALKTVAFAPTTARYVRLEALSEVNGEPWASAAEIEVLDEYGNALSPPPVSGTTITYKLRVKVCDSAVGLESNCETYSSGGVTTHKPVGLIQENAANRRFALSSYLNNNDIAKHGGVMRSLAKYVGPTMPDANGNFVSNPNAEWDDLGILKTDPEGVSSSNPDSIPSDDRMQSMDWGNGAGVTYSGIVNYLNRFQKEHGYKSYDPVSELFYESLHYYRGQAITNKGPTSDFLPTASAEKGGFPAYEVWNDPIEYSCQKNFIVAINDAYAWRDKRVPGAFNFDAALCADDDCGSLSGADTFFLTADHANEIGALESLGNIGEQLAYGVCGNPSNGRQNSYYDAGLAFQANTEDLRPDDFEGKQSVSTFMVDVQEYQSAECDAATGSHVWADNTNHLWLVGKYGGFIDQNENDEPDLTEEWDADGDGLPDNYVPATQPDILVTALRAAFQDIDERTSSATSIATNSTRLDTETLIFQARFNTADWSGQIIAYRVQSDGSVGAEAWSTDDAGLIPGHDSREIYTWNGTVGTLFDTLHWDDLSLPQQGDLQAGGSATDGQDRMDYLRGDQSNELNNGGGFRDRAKVLGDVVNSDPLYVFNPDFGYERLPTGVSGQDTYEAFRVQNHGRQKMLYLGANDGMLHALDAGSGVEQFAFVPESIYPGLAHLTSPSYGHKYFVDGTPNLGDAHIGGGWKTVLLGTPGGGAKSVFALDVTDPASFSENDIMWELTHPELGHVLYRGTVARMRDGSWRAVFGNGYNSTSERAQLFLVDLSDPDTLDSAKVTVIDTGVGSSVAPNGLASPALLVDNERTVVAAYAGDLHGNLWKFDLSDTSPLSWEVAFSSGGNPAPLFTAEDDSGNVQPITGEPEIGTHPTSDGYVIYFGTGRFFVDGDGSVGVNPPVQSFYGIWDNNARVTTGGDRASVLQEQTIDYELTSYGNQWRVVSDNDIDWASQEGWFMDLVSPNNGAEGERSVSTPILRAGRIIFTTLIPSDDICEFGGTSWVMELSTENGGRIDEGVFDVNGDAEFTTDDFVEVPDGQGGTIWVATSGRQSNVGIVRSPSIISSGEKEYKHIGGSNTDRGTNGIEMIRERGESVGRRSWRQVR